MIKYYLILLCMILITIISGCSCPSDVELSVTGTTTKVDIKITIENGDLLKFYGKNIPWSYEYQGGDGDHVWLYAENHQGFGNVTVTIYADGEVLDTMTSREAHEGFYGGVGVGASGYLPSCALSH